MTRDLMLISKPDDENKTTIARGLVLMLLLSSMMQVFTLIPESDGEVNPEITGNEKWLVQAPTLDTGNLKVGGYHLKTGDWWEGKLDAIPDVNDLDGDGVSNNYDNEFWNPNIPAKFVDCAAGCHKTSSANMEDNAALPSWTVDFGVNGLRTGDLGDIDGDGDLDLVFAKSSTIYFSENIQGEFQYPATLAMLNSNKGISLKDVDNDGDLDILALGNTFVKLLEMQGTTIQSTTALIDISSGILFRDIVFGDINGDGFVDFAARGSASGSSPPDEVYIMVNDASSTPSFSSAKNYSESETILLVDLDNNGKDDLVLSSWTNNFNDGLSFYQNSGSSPWFSNTATKNIDTGMAIRQKMAHGDFNHDGAEDIVIFGGGTQSSTSTYDIWVMHNKNGTPGNSGYLEDTFGGPNGQYNVKVELNNHASGYAYSVSVADMNGDGLLDIVTGATSDLSETSIIYNMGFPKPGNSAVFEYGWGTTSGGKTTAVVSDIDGNGRSDIVAIPDGAPIKIHLNRGISLDSNVALSTASPVFNVNNYWGNGEVADTNDDGHQDIIRFGSDVNIFQGDGGLGFNSTPDWKFTNSGVNDIIFEDFNRDGFTDVIDIGNGARIRWGSATGFNNSYDQQFSTDSNLYDISVGMVNYDAIPDVILHQAKVSSTGKVASAFILNMSSGDFEEYWVSPETNSTTGTARSLHLADMNGDRRPDLVRCFDNQAQIFNMTFSQISGDRVTNFSNEPMTLTNVKSTYGACYVEDVNDDGNLDILTKTSAITLYTGPDFSTSNNFGGLPSTWSITLNDIDDDGKLELITASQSSKQTSIYDFTGTGISRVWDGGYYRDTMKIIVKDMDEDGIRDLVHMNKLQSVDIILGVSDTDYDGVKDSSDLFPNNPTQSTDSDSDGFGDSSTGMLADACPYYWGDSTEDRRGCPDQDGDGWSDLNDDFWRDGNQWNDTDLDGYGDNYPAASSSGRPSHWPGEVCPDGGLPCSFDSYPLDWDDDGYEDSTLSPQGAVTPYDDCPFTAGTSSEGDTYGCLDSDIDGWANVIDTYPTQNSQHNDTDGDGFGDNESGWLGDHCPNDFGLSVIDYYGCLDNDNDGVSYLTDLDDSNPSEQSDTDNDTVGDNGDLCPYQWSNLTSGPDRGCPDSDGDLRADRNDAFPTDATQWFDADGDGYGDEPLGNQPDEFTSDPTQWTDTDGDGMGDNANGNNADAFPYDSTQWNDKDGDGYGDQNNGNESDKCKDEAGSSKQRLIGDGSTIEWYGCADVDFDLVPDIYDDCSNTAGTSFLDRIACPDSDNDAVSDMNDPYPYEFSSNASDGDWDNDSYADMRPVFMMNGPDIFPDDSSQWQDFDGDGFGDNQSGNNPDMCLNTPSQASVNELGCASSEIDDDSDGVMNDADLCANTERGEPVDSSGCLDGDEDGVANTQDSFPDDSSQWSDIDGDGYGDNQTGTEADACVSVSGTSRTDRLGCVDSDGDGYSDQGDQCPNLPGWSSAPYQGCPDRDSDGFADVIDLFPDDSNESIDSDGDGFGDNNDTCFSIEANATVDCVNDRDNDGFNDSSDVFPDDASEWSDQDGDGYGDNSDVWPSQSEIWSDGDKDGWADQYGHILTDDCPSIPGRSSKFMMGCSDIDDDGMPDLLDPDIDGDGITNDNEMDASTDLIEYDPFDANSTPPDMDGDSIPDVMDKDTDGDGFPNDMEKERGSDHEDTNKTPFNIYGDQDTGLFYVPGEGFKSQYDPNGMEISVSVVLDMVTSEFLIPMLILPLTMFALLAKGRRYKKMKKRLETCKDADILLEFEKDIDTLIMKKKVKVEHGMLLRNLFERIRDKMGEAKDKPSIPQRNGDSGGPSQGHGRPTPAPKERSW